MARLIFNQTLIEMLSGCCCKVVFLFSFLDCHQRNEFLQFCKGGLHAVTGKRAEVREWCKNWN